MRVIHSRLQHGVGQGSFHSATVEVILDGDVHHRFDYVYDCGALVGGRPSPQLLRSIDRMDLARRPGSGNKAVLDALVLSHFDCDHINGARVLAERFTVRRIYVPYFTQTELSLVLACQAAEIGEADIRALHGLAVGAEHLFGVPVTMVRAGGDDDEQVAPSGPDDPARTNGDQGLPNRPEIPSSLEARDKRTRQVVGDFLPAARDVELCPAGQPGTALWTLRFWNRGVDDNLLVHLFDELVTCDFPLAALYDRGGADEIVDWLEDSDNRHAVVLAYRRAIEAHAPSWAQEASGQRLANFLSLGLYSGPSARTFGVHQYVVPGSFERSLHPDDWYWRRHSIWSAIHDEKRVGWLGTGDAPLGEPGIWADFSAHYGGELNRVLTLQVPHHGAAPAGGPRFFNPALITSVGINAVVSVGSSNSYGHPRASVLKEVASQGGNLVVVTEADWLGFHEVIHLQLP